MKCLSFFVSLKAPSPAPFAAPAAAGEEELAAAEEDLAELMNTVKSADDDFTGGKNIGLRDFLLFRLDHCCLMMT